jgi:hypothetical protein
MRIGKVRYCMKKGHWDDNGAPVFMGPPLFRGLKRLALFQKDRLRSKVCPKCESELLSACHECGAAPQHGVDDGPPQHCGRCGKAVPWTAVPLETAPSDPNEPLKDPIVERVYDYTKWHIALNGAVLALVAGGIAAGQIERFPPLLFISVFLLIFAGIAAGTLASSLSRLEHWKGFLEKKLYPLVPDSQNEGLTVQRWMDIQHGCLWASIVGGFFVAISEILKKQQHSAVKIGVPLALGIVAVFIGLLTRRVLMEGKTRLIVWSSVALVVGLFFWAAMEYKAVKQSHWREQEQSHSDERERYQVLSRSPAKGEWVFLHTHRVFGGAPLRVTASCTEPSPDKCSTFAVGETILTGTSQQTKAGRAWDINETGGQFLTFTQGSASQKFKIEREEVVP